MLSPALGLTLGRLSICFREPCGHLNQLGLNMLKLHIVVEVGKVGAEGIGKKKAWMAKQEWNSFHALASPHLLEVRKSTSPFAERGSGPSTLPQK